MCLCLLHFHFILCVFRFYYRPNSSSQRVAIQGAAWSVAVRDPKVRWSPSPPGPMQRRRHRRGRRRIITTTVTSGHRQIHPVRPPRLNIHQEQATVGSHRSSWAALDGVRRASRTLRRASDAKRPTRKSTSRFKRTNKSTEPLIGSSFSVVLKPPPLSSSSIPPRSKCTRAHKQDTQCDPVIHFGFYLVCSPPPPLPYNRNYLNLLLLYLCSDGPLY